MVRRLAAMALGTLAILLALPSVQVFAEEGSRRPNIVFIFADDLSYRAVRYAGNPDVRTPNIDRLARSGLVFTHAYNQGSWSGAVCVASRTMLNTGRYLWHAKNLVGHLEQERQAGRIWSEQLRRAGYDTYFTGKWHVRLNAKSTFDFVTHVRPGMPKQTPEGYNRPIEGKPDPWSPYDPKFGGFWEGGTHWSEVLRDDARAFLRQAARRNRPFFMYLAFNASHDPRQSPKSYVDRYPPSKLALPKTFLPEYPFKDAMGCGKSLRDERLAPFPRTPYAVRVHRQEYYALITHMDDQIGAILGTLDELGLADNTYVVFTADHGLAVGEHGLFGKQNQFDHSVRVPFIIRGPGIAAGRRIEAPIYLQQVMPTTLEWAGLDVPDFVEFQSLLPLIQGKASRSAKTRPIYGAYLELQRMIVDGRYKLIVYPRVSKVLLFDLQDDPWELRDLASDPAHAKTVQRLLGKLQKLQEKTGDSLDLSGLSQRARFWDE